MAKYDVTYMCGHEETMQLYGPCKERQRKIEYYRENMLCPECYKKEKQREKEEALRTIKTNPPLLEIFILHDIDSRSYNPLFRLCVKNNLLAVRGKLRKIGYEPGTIWSRVSHRINAIDCMEKTVPYECVDAECRRLEELGVKPDSKNVDELLETEDGQSVLKKSAEAKAKKRPRAQAPAPFDEKDAGILLSESPDC